MDEITRKNVIREHYQAMQKRGVAKRLQNDPNSFKKMRAMREEKKQELKVEYE